MSLSWSFVAPMSSGLCALLDNAANSAGDTTSGVPPYVEFLQPQYPVPRLHYRYTKKKTSTILEGYNTAIVNLGSARIELGFELKPPEHEIHQVRPTLKHHIARQGTNIIEKGLASHQHLAKQRILAIAPLQDRMEEKR